MHADNPGALRVAGRAPALAALTLPGSAVPAPDQTSRGAARLSLSPALRRGAGIYGAWWPRSRDAAAELPGLIAEVGRRAGRVSRVAVQADAFSNIPHQLTADGRKVRIAWFRSMNPHTVILTMAGNDDLILLVVPQQASPAAAAAALGLAADHSAGPPEAILAAAGIGALPGPA
jgi:Family of unknown function (DUF5994)